MKTFRMWNVSLALILLAAFITASGCARYRQGAQKKLEWFPKKVAVLPFSEVEPSPGTLQAVSPLSGSVFSTRRSQDGHIGVKVLDASLDKWLRENTRLQLVTAAQAAPVFKKHLRDHPDIPLNQVVAQVGKRLGVDGVLVGYLYRFTRRVGTPYSAELPASVALDVAIVRTSDGAVVWKNTFDERQVSLTENMFNLENYFKYGLTWYTAEEYAVLGLDETMKRFPWTGE